MNGRLRVLLAVVLVAAFVGGGSSVAWALWTATGTTASSVTNGKVVAGITGTEAITTTFTSADPTATRPVTLRNTGNIAGTTATRVLVAAGSVALAQAVDVVAWPVPSADGCTATGDVGSGAVRGTWAALPSLVSHLGPRADAVWCIRSTVRADAPPAGDHGRAPRTDDGERELGFRHRVGRAVPQHGQRPPRVHLHGPRRQLRRRGLGPRYPAGRHLLRRLRGREAGRRVRPGLPRNPPDRSGGPPAGHPPPGP
ncbi:hypothetical protein [Curtobacterium sp. MCJR17_043]|uniref:hypothetical protein n=1 Tax=Curtobacterium sp. MCJR17_043 TaxID=2175660 RepID=UPI0024DFFCB1|nr:hypothetical protein [Curtobacterium sp. MCJR17_043]WIB35487.1 hypothetical protein DEJ15_14835 [Curtobacterium sp. MCJR17_043]